MATITEILELFNWNQLIFFPQGCLAGFIVAKVVVADSFISGFSEKGHYFLTVLKTSALNNNSITNFIWF